MSWMSPNMQMETKAKGGVGGFFGRALSGESGFQNIYTARGGGGLIAFTSSYVGNILAVEITPDKPVIIQKRAFLASTPDVNMEVFFQKKIGTALFGGEGFIMQKLSGSGTVFLELDGSVINYELQSGQQMLRLSQQPVGDRHRHQTDAGQILRQGRPHLVLDRAVHLGQNFAAQLLADGSRLLRTAV